VHSSTGNPLPSVLTGPQALSRFGSWLARGEFERGAVLCDENTVEHCLPVLRHALPMLMSWPVLVVPKGEACKSMEEAVKLWDQLTALSIGRRNLLINLGGGSLTDLGGFVASTYLRGISFVNVPTSLLAMVDASLGGKNGVDLGPIKNRIGTVAFPVCSVCDTVFLKTLPDEGWMDGLAESVKHAIVGDEGLWRMFTESHDVRETLMANLDRIQAVKLMVVEQDPYEKERRMILNFGHSIGHALESCALEAGFQMMTHGSAVAIGMVIESRIAVRLGVFSVADSESIAAYISRYFGDLSISWMDPGRILHFLHFDKKNINGMIRMSLPERIGACRTGIEVSDDLILSVVSENFNRP